MFFHFDVDVTRTNRIEQWQGVIANSFNAVLTVTAFEVSRYPKRIAISEIRFHLPKQQWDSQIWNYRGKQKAATQDKGQSGSVTRATLAKLWVLSSPNCSQLFGVFHLRFSGALSRGFKFDWLDNVRDHRAGTAASVVIVEADKIAKLIRVGLSRVPTASRSSH